MSKKIKAPYKAVFVSDIHLGTRSCKAEFLLKTLKRLSFDEIYMIGDIIDGWKIRRGWYWHQDHTNFLRKILKYSKNKRVVYIAGNHDEFLRNFLSHGDLNIGNVEIYDEMVYNSASGKSYLLTHGDNYDIVTRYHKQIAVLGDIGYETLLSFNRHFNWIRRHLGFGYWSLSKFVKNKVKSAVSFITQFEIVVANECQGRGLDGVVCGHIHSAANKYIDNIHYLNCGDWVESCTLIAEDWNGEFHIIEYNRLAETIPLLTDESLVEDMADEALG
jgi:UDP-2,3-diacylglucosamine pyrophosphatase LpxH